MSSYLDNVKYRERKKARGLCLDGGCWNPSTTAGHRCDGCIAIAGVRDMKRRYHYTEADYARYHALTHCDWCGLLFEENDKRHQDHDHACCPYSNRSCGKCLRGVVHEMCNTRAIVWCEWYESRTGIVLPELKLYREKFTCLTWIPGRARIQKQMEEPKP